MNLIPSLVNVDNTSEIQEKQQIVLRQIKESADRLFEEFKTKTHQDRHVIVKNLAEKKEKICAVYPVTDGFGYHVIKGSIDINSFNIEDVLSIPCGNIEQVEELKKLLNI